MLTAPGERRIVGNGEVETHYPEQRVQEPFGLAQWEMVEEPQGQSGLDGEIRVPPLPTPPAASAGRPGSDRFRGHPHRHIAAANEGPVVDRPVCHAIFRLVRGARSGARDRTIRRVKALGRRRWKKASGDHQQARVENAFFRYKSIVGDCLRARSSSGQRREAMLACNVLNRMTELGRPVSCRIGR